MPSGSNPVTFLACDSRGVAEGVMWPQRKARRRWAGAVPPPLADLPNTPPTC